MIAARLMIPPMPVNETSSPTFPKASAIFDLAPAFAGSDPWGAAGTGCIATSGYDPGNSRQRNPVLETGIPGEHAALDLSVGDQFVELLDAEGAGLLTVLRDTDIPD